MNLNELERNFLLLSPRLQAYVNSRIPDAMRSKLSPDDVLQDVWMLASRRIEHFAPRDERSTRAWLTRIARNTLADRIKERQRAKRSGIYRQAVDGPRSSMLGMFQSIVVSQRSPSQELRFREVESAMKAALNKLPEKRREVLWMKYIQEMPTCDIAERIGKSESAVRSLIAEGLRQLRRLMGEPARYFSDIDFKDEKSTVR